MTRTVLMELAQAELKARAYQAAVLPIGACEVHGLHLPYGTDALMVAEVARRAAERAVDRGADVLVLPTIPFGCDQNLISFPYTVSVQPTTLIKIFDDLIGSLARHGVRKFLLLNGHGGNTGALEAVSRELYGRHEAFIARLDFWMVAKDVVEAVRETTEIEHADEIETSMALALFPELVNMKVAEPSPTNPSRLQLLQKYGGRFSRPWELYTQRGGTGDPTKATPEKGEKIIAATVERLGDILVELVAAKMDSRFPY